MRTWMFAALVSLAPAGVFAEPAETQVIEVIGESAVTGKDSLGAKDRATQDALRRAVEQACGTLGVAHTQTENFQLISDKILTQAKGYVSSYDVLSTAEEKGVVAVKVRATVGTSKLADDLAAIGLTLARKGMPRIAALIAEQRIDEVKPAFWWGAQGAKKEAAAGAMKVDQRIVENALISEWTKSGFTFVDPESVANKARTAGVVSVDLSQEQVRQLGDLSDCDVVIAGSAVSTKMQDQSKLLEGISHGADKLTGVTCSATLSVRAFNADNAEILAATEASASAMNESTLACGRDAMVKASKELSANLKKDLLAAWNRQLSAGSRVQLKVSGIDSLKTLGALKTALSQAVRAVKSVNQKSYKNGVAVLDLQLQGKVDDLGAEMEAWKPGGKKVRVVSMSANQLEVELHK